MRQRLARLSQRFVSLENLRCDWTEMGSQPDPVATPELAAMPVDPVAEHLRASHYLPPRPTAATLSRALFHPAYHVVLTRGRRIVTQSTIQGADMGRLPLRAVYGRVTTELMGASAVLRSRWNNHYHTLVDNLPRLYGLHAHGLAGRTVRVVIGGELSDVERYLVPRMLPPGARVESLPVDGLCLAAQLVMPGFLSRRFAGYLPPSYRTWFLDRVAPARASRRNRRILILRKPTDSGLGRAFENQEELLMALEPLGFESHSLEAMPVADQIALFHDAEIIVGAHGSGLANVLFAQKAAVVELFSAAFVTPHYYFLCKACDHRYRWLCGAARVRNANLHVDIPGLLRILAGLGA